MIDIICLERKRVLNNRLLLGIIILTLIFSVFKSVSAVKKYNVCDQFGNIIITASENLKESKMDKHNVLLDKDTIKSVVIGSDTSRYLYNSNLIKLVASNYNIKVTDLTDKNVEYFYDQRLSNVRENLGGTAQIEDIGKLMAQAQINNVPIKLGYAEGWKALNNELIDFTTLLVYLIPLISISVFGENPKVKTEQLCECTKYGKKHLAIAKLVTAFGLSSIIYLFGIIIYSASYLLILGFNGAGLPIQGSFMYLFCPYSISFWEQYLINVLIGFMALNLLTSTVLLITVLLKQILPSAIVIGLILAIMPMLPNNNFYLNFYVKNFLPFHMTNFNSYYIRPYVYNVFDIIVPTYGIVILVSIIISFLFLFLTYLLKIKKSNKHLR